MHNNVDSSMCAITLELWVFLVVRLVAFVDGQIFLRVVRLTDRIGLQLLLIDPTVYRDLTYY